MRDLRSGLGWVGLEDEYGQGCEYIGAVVRVVDLAAVVAPTYGRGVRLIVKLNTMPIM